MTENSGEKEPSKANSEKKKDIPMPVERGPNTAFPRIDNMFMKKCSLAMDEYQSNVW